MDITTFQGQYRFLSNFYPCPVVLDGVTYPSVEHAYQAAKSLDHAYRLSLLTMTAGEAKRAGKAVGRMRPNWEKGLKLSVMRMLLRQKFRNPDLGKLLLDTAPFALVEENVWGDTFWGVCRGKGHNHLGKLLMETRDLLEKGEL